VLASTSICFDLSVFELFVPLCWGGRAIVVDNALALHDLAAGSQVTLINTVPSAIGELLDLGALPRSVRTVNLAGEPLAPELVERIYRTGSVEKVYDLYGPSETTTYSTFTLRKKKSRATIGRPIGNTKIYLLDAALRPVPIGVAGELFIGGAGVARGYLNRPQLTAEKFFRDPFSRRPGARMYRTGDLARYDAGGNIEYLGRIDNQVKIRGYRIELGEIEAVLNRHPAVRDSVVVARQERARETAQSANPKSKIQNLKLEKKLVAYVVVQGSVMISNGELRNHLRRHLPEYMIPAMFVALEALPLTPNGKVDRRALPLSEGGVTRPTSVDAPPRTQIEELIIQTWRTVLNVDRIGVHDNFFDLGGHSLLAARVAGRLRAHFNVDLPLRRIFELPAVALLGEEIDRLRRSAGGVTAPPIVALPRGDPMPLSFAQRRLWFLHKLAVDLTAYNMPFCHRVRGPLNVTALEASLNEIIRRHETLRTAITEIAGEPMQQVQASARLDLDVIDLRRLAPAQAEEEAQRIFNDNAGQPFDFSRAPLIRAKLLRLGTEDFFLILNFHHLVCDGSSLAIFYRELALIYAAALAQKRASLPALTAQHADFAAWQRVWLDGAAAVPQLSYWKRQLGGGLPFLNLPADFPRPAAQSYRGARVARRLAKDLTTALKQLSRQQGATLFMTLLTALKILLSRLAGQDDVVVGSTVAGRNQPELEGLIGFFINAVALRIDLAGSPTFVELLERVRATCLDAYTHQDLPFERVVEEIHPGRDFSRNPIFQVLFNMADVGERDLVLAGCETSRISQSAPGAKFDLVFQAPEIDGAIELVSIYDADLFSEARVKAMLQQWSDLLAQVVVEPTGSVGQFSLVTDAAKAVLPDPTERLDETWAGAIHSRIADQAEAQPDKLAIIDAQESWRYRDIDRYSSQLANLLIKRGIQPRDAVAIYAHRDATLALAILGVLKAGAVFFILDPAYPAARLLDYLRSAGPKGWIHMMGAGAPPQEVSRFLETKGVSRRIELPRTQQGVNRLLGRTPGGAPEIALAADDPAYIAFTSGSTGEPKGVLCRHGPITHFLAWQEEIFELKKSDRYSLVSGLGYNHLQRELFTALASGAIVYIPADDQLKEPEKLARWLRRSEISVLHLTPALGRLLRTARNIQLPSVRRVFFGGDLLTRRDVDAMRKAAPNADIISFYGATETQRAVGYFVIPKKLSTPGGVSLETVPTGTGVKDVQLLLLNAGRQLAGVGELGEIFVRSPHLAAGYVGDDALTGANFMTNPFTGDQRDRLYRTGELGRYLPDGNVEWAGRRDHCVSIRGFRVELAEVEAALGQHARIRHVAVAAQEFASGDAASVKETRLVAYVERDKDYDLGADDLRAFLSVRLPQYMVPSYFHFMDRLPISPNGKVDYFNLPAVGDLERKSRVLFEAPRTAMEERLSKIFAAVLGIPKVSRLDNFFDLGGHSLLAAQVAAQVREATRTNLDLRNFLQVPTVAALAQLLESGERVNDKNLDPHAGEREEIEL
jgi:amino acid adenylation domain-containing protein